MTTKTINTLNGVNLVKENSLKQKHRKSDAFFSS